MLVARWVFNTHIYSTNCFNNALEPLEVNFHVVMNGNVECALHRAHQHIGAFLICGVDALLVFSITDGHPQVAWNGHERNRSRALHVVQHHERVASLAANITSIANIAVVGVAWVGTYAGV